MTHSRLGQNISALVPIICVMSCLLLLGCNKNEPAAYESGKCYQANIIRGFCPSVTVVTVANANIGTEWEYQGKRYKNALAIYNGNYDSLVPNDKIYFTIDIDATSRDEKCYLPIPCQQWVYDQSSPGIGICTKTISNKPCERP
jgi:hypothetical protein